MKWSVQSLKFEVIGNMNFWNENRRIGKNRKAISTKWWNSGPQIEKVFIVKRIHSNKFRYRNEFIQVSS